jgi:hypothetical protein
MSTEHIVQNSATTTSGISLNNFTFTGSAMTDKAEAIQLYIEAASWIMVDVTNEAEDTSEDWKIIPMHVIDPKLQEQWKKERLWMMDPMDVALGDDAMPALCGSCDGVFWGDQMVSVAKTIIRLRVKHSDPMSSFAANIWKETEPNIVNKLRANRICKKCYTVSVEACVNPWRFDYSDPIQVPSQQSLPFNNVPSSFQQFNATNPNMVGCSGMAPPPGGWNINYTNYNDDSTADCVSDTFIDTANEDDI